VARVGVAGDANTATRLNFRERKTVSAYVRKVFAIRFGTTVWIDGIKEAINIVAIFALSVII
jgi:hypothetical protein